MGEQTQDQISEKLYGKIEKDPDDDWKPSVNSVVKLLFTIRLCSAIFGIVSYSDEVYNNWEPLHMIIHGEGFQTWEFSPSHAMGSYLFIYLHYIPAYVFAFFAGFSKIAQFTMVRVVIGLFCIGGEYFAFNTICQKINVSVGRLFLLFSMLSPGMYQASTSLSPCSYSMICSIYFLACYLNEYWIPCIFLVTISTLIGWPFSVILLLPIFVMCVWRKEMLTFTISLIVFVPMVLALQVGVDSHFYGKTVMVPYNVVVGSIGTSTGGALEKLTRFIRNLLPGNEVEGYLANAFLNWNIAVFVAPLSLYYVWEYMQDASKKKHEMENKKKLVPLVLLFVSMIQWVLMFVPQPSFNAKYMAPIYPLIALFAALACDAMLRISKFRKQGFYRVYAIAVISVFVAISVLRILSLSYSFGAHIEIYKTFNKELLVHPELDRFNDPIRLCVGKEWHRFPSSFFLPDEVLDEYYNERSVELRFLRSNYDGILPKRFLKLDRTIYIGDDRLEITRHVPSDRSFFDNDDSTFVSLDSCDYVIDVDFPEKEKEPDFRTMTNQWMRIESIPIANRLDPRFNRAYSVLFAYKVQWTNCTLYRRVMF